MKKPVIGYIYYDKNLKKDEKIFLKIAKEKKIELVMFNLAKDFEDKEIEEKARKCSIIFNNSAENSALELVKTFEEFGKKVVESSRSYYYTEDKWMFFLKCKEHGIPTPRTSLLSEDISLAKKELTEINSWPIVLKRVEGTCGQYVKKAENINQAEKIIKSFWKKGSERLPVIAQEYIDSPCYRLTIIGGKIVQTSVKNSKSWKKTGVYAKHIKKFSPDKKLREIIKKLLEATKLNICGVDLLKKGKNWVVLEINAEPALDFFESQREKLIRKILNLLIKLAK